MKMHVYHSQMVFLYHLSLSFLKEYEIGHTSPQYSTMKSIYLAKTELSSILSHLRISSGSFHPPPCIVHQKPAPKSDTKMPMVTQTSCQQNSKHYIYLNYCRCSRQLQMYTQQNFSRNLASLSPFLTLTQSILPICQS